MRVNNVSGYMITEIEKLKLLTEPELETFPGKKLFNIVENIRSCTYFLEDLKGHSDITGHKEFDKTKINQDLKKLKELRTLLSHLGNNEYLYNKIVNYIVR